MENKALLERYVNESNAIENISVGKNHHLFIDHLKAAELVWQSAEEFKVVMMPENIHKVLMKNELSDAGNYRKVKVWVGLESKARPENVARLMERWKDYLLRDLWVPSEASDKLAWHYHHWFEAIHPFIDGNGRTGRLILNNIRLLFGLPWLIVPFTERAHYYDSIRRWEAEHKSLLELS